MRRIWPMLLGLIVLLCAGLGFIWYLSLEPDRTPMSLAEASNSSRPLPAPAPAGQVERPVDAITGPDAAPTEVVEPAVPVAAAGAIKEEPPRTPVYGDAVKRGGARAEFTLVDQQGQPLFEPQAVVKLWRKIGSFWQVEHGQFDAEQCKVVCGGSEDQGLEPGEYEVEIDAAGYGAWRHAFSVVRGELKRDTLRTPHWYRVLCFKFADQSGAGVPWISRPPRLVTVEEPLPAVDRNVQPKGVLRSPPSDEALGLGGGGGKGGRGGFRYQRPRRTVYATDSGRFYVPVHAGRVTEVAFDFEEKIWGTNEVKFKETFTEPKWSEHQVTLSLVPDFSEVLSPYARELTDDPGRRSCLRWLELTQNPPPLTDESTVGANLCRVVLNLSAPAEVVPSLAAVVDDEPGQWVAMKKRGGQWWLEMRRASKAMLKYQDDGLFESAPQALELPDAPVHVMHETLRLPMATFPQWRLSPTLDSWALRRDLMFTFDFPESGRVPGPAKAVRPAAKMSADLRRADHVMAGRFPELLENASSIQPWVEIEGASVGGRAEFGKSCDTPAPAKVLSGNIRLPSPESGIAFRVVGPMTEGLPWVEASLLTLEEDQVARLVREHELAEIAAGTRPDLESVTTEYLKELEAAEKDDKVDRSADLALPESMLKRLADRSQRLWYARNGAWYSTHRHLSSDAHGYVVNFNLELAAGKRYVLYLWSASRYDMKPDLRIVFEATSGVTDLGAITLPAYTG